MWNRAEVKNKGKVNFKKNYWKSVLVAFIYSLFFVGSSAAYSTRRQEIQDSSLNDPNVTARIACDPWYPFDIFNDSGSFPAESP